jgi:thioredoxin-related protein
VLSVVLFFVFFFFPEAQQARRIPRKETFLLKSFNLWLSSPSPRTFFPFEKEENAVRKTMGSGAGRVKLPQAEDGSKRAIIQPENPQRGPQPSEEAGEKAHAKNRFTLLVSLKQDSGTPHKLKVDAKSAKELKNFLRNHFQLSAEAEISYFDAEFGEYVRLEKLKYLPRKAKILINEKPSSWF